MYNVGASPKFIRLNLIYLCWQKKNTLYWYLFTVCGGGSTSSCLLSSFLLLSTRYMRYLMAMEVRIHQDNNLVSYIKWCMLLPWETTTSHHVRMFMSIFALHKHMYTRNLDLIFVLLHMSNWDKACTNISTCATSSQDVKKCKSLLKNFPL